MVGGEGRTPRGGGTGPRPTEGETDRDSAWKWGRKGLRMLPWSLHREPEDSRWGAVLGLWGSTSNLRAQRSLGWRHVSTIGELEPQAWHRGQKRATGGLVWEASGVSETRWRGRSGRCGSTHRLALTREHRGCGHGPVVSDSGQADVSGKAEKRPEALDDEWRGGGGGVWKLHCHGGRGCVG